MAYANYLASVEWAEVISVRKGLRNSVVPHSVTVVSHLYAYAVQVPPVAQCLTQILDRGEVLSESYWHPLRVPVVHSPEAVRALVDQLRSALQDVNPSEVPGGKPDPSIVEIIRVLDDAAKSSHAIVSALEPPTDDERARRVICPFDQAAKLPVPWGILAKRFKKLRRKI